MLLNIMVLCLSLKIFKDDGSFRSISTTDLIGEGPDQFLVVSSGSSSKAVFVPTNIEASSLLHLCTKRFVCSLEINKRSAPLAAIFLSPVSAHFKIIYGRCFV